MKKNLKKVILSGLIGGIAIMGLSLSPRQALAVPYLDFGVIAPTTGSISYAGGSNPLVGIGIDVDNVLGGDTTLNNGAIRNCIGCIFSFTTGASTGSWSWGGTGSVTLTGAIDLNNNNVIDSGDATGTLLSGAFGTAQVTKSGGTFRVAVADFKDTKNQTLLAFYGLPGGQYDGNFNISFNASGNIGDSFSSIRVLSGDIVNTPVPEPTSLLLLGSGLLGLAFYGRKKNSKV